jgi:DNA repair protein SbcC/Rad50
MIPLRLNLKNFMSYTDVHEPLRFDGIHVAVLAGDNGHGKSALLDAITWALWGRARGRSVDELIHTGATDMEVEFEFCLDDHQYRVIRKRQRRGKTGYSDLQFAVLSDGGYKSLTERSLAETERLIERTLRMSYETFTNSSFIQQGRADTFTTNSPTERKRVLAEILELGTYDELESRAKDAYKERDALLGEERRQSQLWEHEIARRPEYQAQAERLKVELAEVESALAHIEQEFGVARERVARLETLQRQVAEIDARLQRFAADYQRLKTTLGERQAALAEAHSLLGRAEEVERAAAELANLRRELDVAEAKQQVFLPLERQREAALRTLSAEQARLAGEVGQLTKQIAELRTVVERGPLAERELHDAKQALLALVHVEQQHARLQERVLTCREEAAEKRTVNAQLKKEMHELKARIGDLEHLAVCPTCDRPLDRRHKDGLRQALTQQGKHLAEEFRVHEASYRELDAAVKRDDGHLRELAEMLVNREPLQRRLAVAETAVAQIRDAQLKIGLLDTELAERNTLLTEQRFASQARKQLAEADARLVRLGYDEAAHTRLRARAAELSGVDREQQALERARLQAEHLSSSIVELEASLGRLDQECAAERQHRGLLQAQADALGAERDRLAQLDAQLQSARQRHAEVRDDYAQVVRQLDTCAFYERKREESLHRQDRLLREQEIYATLATAFGKKGVQAMIIETAIPEIEDETNRLLARMTDGRMNVKFETQRDARSGTGVIETLDIKISDELGTRSYEMFSGGESFRVNFAIRIALSRLLAHRAGTRLQTLIVDEGFGSQDQEGRDRIVEAIQAIEREFEKILVITHLEDLRERFPVRIEVQKTPHGSVLSLC